MAHPRTVLFVALSVFAVAFAGCAADDETQDAGAKKGTGGGVPGGGKKTDDLPLSERPHVHDSWRGATEMLLLEESIPLMVFHNHAFDEPPREQHTHGCDETLTSDSQGGSKKFTLPPGFTVPPGTARLVFTAAWDASSITGVRLLYRPASQGHEGLHDHGFTSAEEASSSAAAGSFQDGGVFTQGGSITIDVDTMESDDGHAVRSRWAFFLCAASDIAYALAEGEVELKITAERAEVLPLEPAHPDHWGDAGRMGLGNTTWNGEAVGAYNKGDYVWLQLPFKKDRIVPPYTDKVEVFLNFTNDSPYTGLDKGSFLLYHRDPLQPEHIYTKTEPSVEQGVTKFVVRIDDDTHDSVYATQSQWDFWLRIVSSTHQETAAGEAAAPNHFDGSVAVSIEAVRAY